MNYKIIASLCALGFIALTAPLSAAPETNAPGRSAEQDAKKEKDGKDGADKKDADKRPHA